MKFLKGWKELAFIFVLAIGSAYLVRALFLAPYRVPTGSMQPALKPGDFIFVSQLAYGLKWQDQRRLFERLPSRGDLVTFFYPGQPGTAYVKRVIALPGDRVEFKKNRLIINGQALDYEKIEDRADNPNPDLFDIYLEKYFDLSWRIILERQSKAKSFGPLVIPPGQVFLIGDNRDASDDSRYWGSVPTDQIFGQVTIIWLSLDWQKKWATHRFPSVRWERIFTRVH